MPELPEVETIANGVDARVRGRTIFSIWLGSKPEPFRSTPAELVKALTGSRIERVRRVGKHIVVDLARESAAPRRRSTAVSKKSQAWHGQWLVHLGMTGRLLVCQPGEPTPKHTHAILQLDDAREVRFVDPRRFGRLSVLDLSAEAAPTTGKRDSGVSARDKGFAGPGQEPLDISADAFRALFRGRRTPIKSALLNQKLLHGVGNIYADESLFRAGIRPRRQAGRLTAKELERLRSAIQSVLREAIALGGSSVSDYVDASGEKGFFQLEHKVYLRTGEPCLVCGTPIRRILVVGRGTHFCPHCQH
ncbi:MAG TPA: bifunctional DNA-formamidopyrimidine glycosylase/DNA-(apurinic or apyrimidinic site) lyase [Acidobacteriaceae bacterium]|nr:bifunctional DNA-formamidopyrimidine glycosylase/DNA-(apurinic or apyrimidinic site) lyase [Acidobacteriaceae bacterium]